MSKASDLINLCETFSKEKSKIAKVADKLLSKFLKELEKSIPSNFRKDLYVSNVEWRKTKVSSTVELEDVPDGPELDKFDNILNKESSRLLGKKEFITVDVGQSGVIGSMDFYIDLED